MSDINKQLDEAIPRSAVSQRQGGGGRSLSYLTSHYVIDRLNKIFGNLGWASSTTKLECVHVNTAANTVHYIAQVRLVVQGENGVATEHLGTGYGDGSDKNNIGKAYELAVKEAESDALKRAAKNLGMSMGLALYDKDQTNVEDDSRPKVASKQQNEPKQAKVAEKLPKGDSSIVLSEINSYAKIIAAKGYKTITQLKEEMAAKYGHSEKEKLSEPQAVELRDSLKQQASV
jgi:DNA repair and recombination protein RAD52